MTLTTVPVTLKEGVGCRALHIGFVELGCFSFVALKL